MCLKLGSLIINCLVCSLKVKYIELIKMRVLGIERPNVRLESTPLCWPLPHPALLDSTQPSTYVLVVFTATANAGIWSGRLFTWSHSLSWNISALLPGCLMTVDEKSLWQHLSTLRYVLEKTSEHFQRVTCCTWKSFIFSRMGRTTNSNIWKKNWAHKRDQINRTRLKQT